MDFYRPCPVRDVFYRRCGMRQEQPERKEPIPGPLENPLNFAHQHQIGNADYLLELFRNYDWKAL